MQNISTKLIDGQGDPVLFTHVEIASPVTEELDVSECILNLRDKYILISNEAKNYRYPMTDLCLQECIDFTKEATVDLAKDRALRRGKKEGAEEAIWEKLTVLVNRHFPQNKKELREVEKNTMQDFEAERQRLSKQQSALHANFAYQMKMRDVLELEQELKEDINVIEKKISELCAKLACRQAWLKQISVACDLYKSFDRLSQPMNETTKQKIHIENEITKSKASLASLKRSSSDYTKDLDYTRELEVIGRQTADLQLLVENLDDLKKRRNELWECLIAKLGRIKVHE